MGPADAVPPPTGQYPVLSAYAPPTVADGRRGDDLELLPEPGIEQPGEVEPVRALLPAREVRDAVAVVDEAAGAQLAELADLGVDRGEQQARVRDGAVRDVARAVVPREADARDGLVAPPRPGERRRALRWQELHDARDRVRRAVAHAPARRAVDVVCAKIQRGVRRGRRGEREVPLTFTSSPFLSVILNGGGEGIAASSARGRISKAGNGAEGSCRRPKY